MSWIALAMLAMFVGLDATSFPQAMISRPLIAGTLAGLVFGRPDAGLAVGAVLEVYSLIILPFGAARYPESGTAAAAAAAAYAQASSAAVEPRLLFLTVVFAFAWEQISGASVIFVRRINERLVSALPADPLAAVRVARRHLLALAIDGVR